MIVGNFVGKEALAAVGGTTSVLINFFVNLFVGISSGATVVIAQAYGARRFDDVKKAVHTSMALVLWVGAAIMLLGLGLSHWALRLAEKYGIPFYTRKNTSARVSSGPWATPAAPYIFLSSPA